MIKFFFILFILIGNFGFSQVIRVDFDKYGGSRFAEYNKKKHALPFYLVEKGVYQTQLPIRFFNDTLHLRLIKKKNSYFPEKIECLNQKGKPWQFSYDIEKRLITVKSDSLEKSTHLYDFSSREGRLLSAGYIGDELAVDTSEWLGIERKWIMYGDLKIKDKVYTIAVLNLNVITAHGFDASSISIDISGSMYKTMTRTARSGSLSDTKFLDFEGDYFRIVRIDLNGEYIEIEKCDKIDESFTIYYDTKLRAFDYVFEGSKMDVNSLLEDGKYLIIDVFSEFCPPCIRDFPILNEMQERYGDKATILGLFEGNQKDLIRLEETFSIEYPLGLLNEEIKRDLLQNGFPYKIIISPSGEIMHRKVSNNKLEEFLKSL